MFYLKRVVLEVDSDESFRGVSLDGEECGKTMKDWICFLQSLGIEVVRGRQTEDLESGCEGKSQSGANQSGANQNGANQIGTMWVTNDLAKAREYAKQKKPVLGLFDDHNLGQNVDGISYLAFDIEEAEVEYLEEAYRRQAGIPYDVLETERCLVRETAREDAEALYQIYAEPSATAYMEELPKDRDAFCAWLEDYSKNVYGFLGYGIWTVCLKDGSVIGRAGLNLRGGFDDPELGYLIAKPWQGQGIAYEVCSAILEHAKTMGLTQVLAFAEPENKASIGLLAKLGFERKQEINLDGKDCIEFSMELT